MKVEIDIFEGLLPKKRFVPKRDANLFNDHRPEEPKFPLTGTFGQAIPQHRYIGTDSRITPSASLSPSIPVDDVLKGPEVQAVSDESFYLTTSA